MMSKTGEILNSSKTPSLGLALSGGAVRGAAHVGVLKAFEEYGITVEAVSGTSIGAIVGALYAFGLKSKEIEAFARKLNWLDISRFVIPRLGLLSNHEIGEKIEKLIGKAKIEEAKIPLAIVATDITTGEKVVLRAGDIATAVMASSCIPGIFTPVMIDGRMLVDGMLVENIPITPLLEIGAQKIVAVDLEPRRHEKTPDDIVEVVMRSLEIVIRNHSKTLLKYADVIINPDVTEFSRRDMANVPELIDRGYVAARSATDSILRLKGQRRRQPRGGLLQRLKRWLADLQHRGERVATKER